VCCLPQCAALGEVDCAHSRARRRGQPPDLETPAPWRKHTINLAVRNRTPRQRRTAPHWRNGVASFSNQTTLGFVVQMGADRARRWGHFCAWRFCLAYRRARRNLVQLRSETEPHRRWRPFLHIRYPEQADCRNRREFDDAGVRSARPPAADDVGWIDH